MAGVNKVILIGNLGQDPEVRYMPSGDAVANISVATSETWKDKNTGEKQERVEWHKVSFFGKIAEVVGKYLKKGSKIYVEGKLRTRKYKAADGSERYTTEVIVDMGGTMQMLDSKQDGQAPRQQQQPRMDAQNRASMSAQAPAGGNWEDDGDMIPFAQHERGWIA